MADFYSVEYTNQYRSTPAVQANSLHKQSSKKWLDTYEASGTASGSVLYFFKLPAGHAIVGGGLWRDALGSSVTLKVGTTTTDDLLLAATASNTANLFTALTIPVDTLGVPVTTDTNIVVTVGGAAATGTIKLMLETIAA